MKHNITFTPGAFEAYQEWAVDDKQKFKKINELIQSIDRTPFEGIGKPEPLKHQLKGCWSRQISDEHRLVYQVISDIEIMILQCKYHY
jgi:toxin YoeB